MNSHELDLEQFRSLRAEILRAMEDGNQVMAFGLASIGVVLAAAMEASDSLIGVVVFGLVLPTLCVIVLSMWFSSLERLARASHFISGVEARLTAAVGKGAPPTWDLWLRRATPDKLKKSNHFWSNDLAGIAMFAFLIAASMSMSLIIPGGGTATTMRLTMLAAPTVILISFSLSMRTRFKRWQAWLKQPFGAELP